MLTSVFECIGLPGHPWPYRDNVHGHICTWGQGICGPTMTCPWLHKFESQSIHGMLRPRSNLCSGHGLIGWILANSKKSALKISRLLILEMRVHGHLVNCFLDASWVHFVFVWVLGIHLGCVWARFWGLETVSQTRLKSHFKHISKIRNAPKTHPTHFTLPFQTGCKTQHPTRLKRRCLLRTTSHGTAANIGEHPHDPKPLLKPRTVSSKFDHVGNCSCLHRRSWVVILKQTATKAQTGCTCQGFCCSCRGHRCSGQNRKTISILSI